MGDCSTAVVTAVAPPPPPSVLRTHRFAQMHSSSASHIHKDGEHHREEF